MKTTIRQALGAVSAAVVLAFTGSLGAHAAEATTGQNLVAIDTAGYTIPPVSPFVDVSPGADFYAEMAWMAEAGISGGWATGAGKEYRPHTAVDRDVMAAFLYRLAGSPAYTAPAVSPFVDVSPGADFYAEMAWMAEAGISGGWATGAGKEYRPHTVVDRDVMAAFLYRLAGSPVDPGTAVAALAELPVASAWAAMPYDREAQYGGWIDADDDCADTRNEILARDLTNVVSDGCRVLSGTLVDPYTGQVIDFTRGVATSSEVQIDHVVALGAAHITGAGQLPQATRVAFANDPLNLLAVDGPTNGAKSDHDASEWLPPNQGYRCEFVARQIAVKARYGLWVTVPEKTAMAGVLSTCPDQILPEAGTAPDIPTAPQPVQEPAPEPVDPADVYYANCDAAREAGAAPLYLGQPGYRDALDGDDDGTACE